MEGDSPEALAARRHVQMLLERARGRHAWPVELVEVVQSPGRGWRVGLRLGGRVPLYVFMGALEHEDLPRSRNFAFSYRYPGIEDASLSPKLEGFARTLCEALARADVEPAPPEVTAAPPEAPASASEPVLPGPAPEPRPSVSISLVSTCGRACLFCEDQYRRVVEPGYVSPRDRGQLKILDQPRRRRAHRDEVFECLERAAREQPDARIEWGGVDCLASPIFDECLEHAHALGFRDMGVVSPGTRLAEPGFAAYLAHHGVRHVSVTAHGATDTTHDHIAGLAGARDLLRQGLDALASESIDVGVRIPILRQNLAELPSLVEQMLARPVQLALFYWYPDPGQEEFFLEMAPPYPQVEDALRAVRAGGASPVAMPVESIPPCALSPALRQWLRLAYGVTDELAGRVQMTRVPACARCRLADTCPGVPRVYAQAHDVSALRPLEPEERVELRT